MSRNSSENSFSLIIQESEESPKQKEKKEKERRNPKSALGLSHEAFQFVRDKKHNVRCGLTINSFSKELDYSANFSVEKCVTQKNSSIIKIITQ